MHKKSLVLLKKVIEFCAVKNMEFFIKNWENIGVDRLHALAITRDLYVIGVCISTEMIILYVYPRQEKHVLRNVCLEYEMFCR